MSTFAIFKHVNIYLCQYLQYSSELKGDLEKGATPLPSVVFLSTLTFYFGTENHVLYEHFEMSSTKTRLKQLA